MNKRYQVCRYVLSQMDGRIWLHYVKRDDFKLFHYELSFRVATLQSHLHMEYVSSSDDTICQILFFAIFVQRF